MIVLMYLLTVIAIASGRFRHRQHRQHHDGKALRARIRQNQRYHALLQYLDRKEKIVNARTDFDIALHYPQYSRHDSYHDEKAPRGHIHPKRRDNDENYVYAKAQQEFHDVAAYYDEMEDYGPAIVNYVSSQEVKDNQGTQTILELYRMSEAAKVHKPGFFPFDETSAQEITDDFNTLSDAITSRLAELEDESEKGPVNIAYITGAVADVLKGVEKLLHFYLPHLFDPKKGTRKDPIYKLPWTLSRSVNQGENFASSILTKTFELLPSVWRKVRSISVELQGGFDLIPGGVGDLFSADEVGKSFGSIVNVLIYWISHHYKNIDILINYIVTRLIPSTSNIHYLSILPLNEDIHSPYAAVYHVPKEQGKTTTILLGPNKATGEPDVAWAQKTAGATISDTYSFHHGPDTATYSTRIVMGSELKGVHSPPRLEIYQVKETDHKPDLFPSPPSSYEETAGSKVMSEFKELESNLKADLDHLHDDLLRVPVVVIRSPYWISTVSHSVAAVLQEIEKLFYHFLPYLFDKKKTGDSKEDDFPGFISGVVAKPSDPKSISQDLLHRLHQVIVYALRQIKPIDTRVGSTKIFEDFHVSKVFGAIVKSLVYWTSEHYSDFATLIWELEEVFNDEPGTGYFKNEHYLQVLWDERDNKAMPETERETMSAVYHVYLSTKKTRILVGGLNAARKPDKAWAEKQFPTLP